MRGRRLGRQTEAEEARRGLPRAEGGEEHAEGRSPDRLPPPCYSAARLQFSLTLPPLCPPEKREDAQHAVREHRGKDSFQIVTAVCSMALAISVVA